MIVPIKSACDNEDPETFSFSGLIQHRKLCKEFAQSRSKIFYSSIYEPLCVVCSFRHKANPDKTVVSNIPISGICWNGDTRQRDFVLDFDTDSESPLTFSELSAWLSNDPDYLDTSFEVVRANKAR